MCAFARELTVTRIFFVVANYSVQNAVEYIYNNVIYYVETGLSIVCVCSNERGIHMGLYYKKVYEDEHNISVIVEKLLLC